MTASLQLELDAQKKETELQSKTNEEVYYTYNIYCVYGDLHAEKTGRPQACLLKRLIYIDKTLGFAMLFEAV